MKWKIALLVFGVTMITVGTPGFGLTAGTDFKSGQQPGKVIAIGPVCTPNGPCGSGGKFIALGPVCFPNEPCGLGRKIIAIGPVCTPNGPCGSGGTRS
jgi:hypothetical protein